MIKEQSALKIEWWSIRAGRAIIKAGTDLGDIGLLGWRQIVTLGPVVFMRAIGTVDPAEAKPLLDEMLECVTIVPDPVRNAGFSRELTEDDIQELSTLELLRSEVFELHAGFSFVGFLSSLMATDEPTAPNSNGMSTSPPALAPSSQQGSPPSTNVAPATPSATSTV